MKITSLAPWYGAKRALASRIIEHFGEHQVYWEPFCGSMAMLFAKDQVRQETVNDLHKDLANLATVVADPKKACELEWMLRRTLVSEDLFKRSRDWLTVFRNQREFLGDVERAYHYFVASWMGMNGVAGLDRTSASFAKRYTSNGGCPAHRFVSAVDSLPDWHERLRNVMIYNSCGLAMCEKIEDKTGTLIYCDPPYIAKSDSYAHDFESEDHLRLARALQRFQKTKVIVSYYEHDLLDTLYPNWKKVSLETTKLLFNPNQPTEKALAPEVILINR